MLQTKGVGKIKTYFKISNIFAKPIPMADQSKAWICGCSPAEIVGLIPAGDGCLFVVGVVCCQVKDSATS